MQNVERQCAYCHGKGKDPFRILSSRSICGVCSGKGTVHVPTPSITCAHCRGTGAVKRFSCIVCHGTGVVYREPKPITICPTCRGSGDDASMPALECLDCRGRGWLKLVTQVKRAPETKEKVEQSHQLVTHVESVNSKETTEGVKQPTTHGESVNSGGNETKDVKQPHQPPTHNSELANSETEIENVKQSLQNEIRGANSSLNNSLIAHYPFNGNANDASGNNLHATVHGATLAVDRFNTPNRAYTFNGKGEKIIVKDAPPLNFGTNDFSIMVWVKTSQTGIWKRIITKRASSPSWYSLAVHSNKAVFEIYPSGNLFSASVVNDGTWHFICVVRGQKTFSMYIDGTLQTTILDSGLNLDSPGSNLEIGVWSNESYDTGTFNGSIDDVRLYNRDLSSDEVKQIYQLTSTETEDVKQSHPSETKEINSNLSVGLIAHYPFSGNANDASGNNLHGTVHGATLAVDRFNTSNCAYTFYGKGEKIIVEDAPPLSFGTSDLSIMAWIKTNQTGIGKRIVTKRASNNSSSNTWYSLGIYNGRGRFEIYPGGDLLSTSTINDGTWHFICVVRGQKTFSMYIDGTLQTTMPDSGLNLDSPGSNLEIGVWGNESRDVGTFSGSIDDIRLYNRALSSDEVKQIYQLTS